MTFFRKVTKKHFSKLVFSKKKTFEKCFSVVLRKKEPIVGTKLFYKDIISRNNLSKSVLYIRSRTAPVGTTYFLYFRRAAKHESRGKVRRNTHSLQLHDLVLS